MLNHIQLPHQHMQHLSTTSLRQLFKAIQNTDFNNLMAKFFIFKPNAQAYEAIATFKCQFTTKKLDSEQFKVPTISLVM